MKLEVKDVLRNINHMQAAERAEKCRFLSLVTLTFYLDLQTRASEDQTHLPCEFGSRGISYTYKRTTDCWSQKHNLPQFTACGIKKYHLVMETAGLDMSLRMIAY